MNLLSYLPRATSYKLQTSKLGTSISLLVKMLPKSEINTIIVPWQLHHKLYYYFFGGNVEYFKTYFLKEKKKVL
jgi:hypothetical protein